MAGKTIDMSKLRKVIKLYVGGKSKVFISNYLGLSRNTVKKYINDKGKYYIVERTIVYYP